MTAAARAALLAVVVLSLGSHLLPSSLAHGCQESSTPAPNSRFHEPPTEVIIRMTEPVEVGQTNVRVLDANETDHTTEPVGSPEGAQSAVLVQPVSLPGNGTYTVTWRTLWVSDGHITEGAFAFIVGNATLDASALTAAGAAAELPSYAETAFRALGFASWIVAAGALAYPRLVAERAYRRHPATRGEGQHMVGRRAAWVGLLASIAAFIAAVGSWGDQAMRAGFGPTGLLALAQETTIGFIFATRTLLAVLLVVATTLVLRTQKRHLAASVVAVAGLITLTLSSHARAAQADVPVAAFSDVIHLIAAAAWVGTLVMLLLTLTPTMRLLPYGERAQVIGPLATNVSLLATVSVVALLLTGTFAGLIHVGTWTNLVATLYGRVLLLKLGIVGVLLVLGFINRQWFVPAYTRAQGSLPEGGAAIHRFRTVIATEVILMALVLAATGVLAGVSPQEASIAAGPQMITLDAEGNEFLGTLTLAPATVGVNHVTLTTQLDDGAPVQDAKALTLSLHHLDSEIPPIETVLDETAPGRFEGNITISMPGDWLATATLQRETAYDDQADFFFHIRS